MPTAAEKLQMLKDAYEIENELLGRWRDDARNAGDVVPGFPGAGANPVLDEFLNIWGGVNDDDGYFDTIMNSNQNIIDLCDAGLNDAGNEQQHVDNIRNRLTAEMTAAQPIVETVRNAVPGPGENPPEKTYLSSLRDQLELEVATHEQQIGHL